MIRERVTITKWKLEAGRFVRVRDYDDDPTKPYDWALEGHTITIGRISIEAVDDDNQMQMANVEIALENASDHVGPLRNGLMYGYFQHQPKKDYYYEVVVEIQGNADDDARWMQVGTSDDMLIASHEDDLPDAEDNEYWIAVFGGYILPGSMTTDEQSDTIVFSVGAYDMLLKDLQVTPDVFGAYAHPLTVYRVAAYTLWNMGLRLDYDLIQLPSFGMLARAISAGPTSDSLWHSLSAHLLAVLRVDSDELYLIDYEGNGYRSLPGETRTDAAYTVEPYTDSAGGFYQPEQCGFKNIDDIADWDIDTYGFPHKGGAVDDEENWYGEGFVFGMHLGSPTRYSLLGLKKSGGYLILRDFMWRGPVDGYLNSGVGDTNMGSYDGEPESGWTVIAFRRASHNAFFLSKPNSDEVRCLWTGGSATVRKNDHIGEIMQWTVDRDTETIRVLIHRHEDGGYHTAGWYQGELYEVASFGWPGIGLDTYGSRLEIHESAKNLPKGRAIRTVDTSNPTGYRWVCPVVESGQAKVYYYDNNWQLLDCVDFGYVHPPESDGYEDQRDYFDCTADGEWIIHESKLYRYGRTSEPAVRITRGKPDDEPQDYPTLDEILSEISAQIFCAWWLRPDTKLRVKPLYSGSVLSRNGLKLIENAKWGFWEQNTHGARIAYGTENETATMGDGTLWTKIDSQLTSTRSMALWLATQYWAVHCTEQSHAILDSRQFTTELYNQLLYGVLWSLKKIEITNARSQISTEMEAITVPIDTAGIISTVEDMLALLALWQVGSGYQWVYDNDVPGYELCAPQARALLEQWCVLLNAADPAIEHDDAVMPFLMEQFIEWAELADALTGCMTGGT